MTAQSLKPGHALLALVAIAIWGTNFVIIKVALDHVPPLTLAALRFIFAALPAAFFIKPPKVAWGMTATYGVMIGVGQFGVLYIAMRSSISPGLTSLVVQTQAFFTIALAMLVTRERLRGFQLAALGLAALGLGWLIAHAGGEATPMGVALVLFAALAWAGGNTVQRAANPSNILAFVVWSSLFAIPPLIALALVFDGWPAIARDLTEAGPGTWAAVLWQSVGNTLFGYAAWGWLLARYPAATVSPTALLVPVFGMATSSVLLGESLPPWKLIAAGLVLGGLALNTLWPMRAQPRLT